MSKAQIERAKQKQSKYWHERFLQLQEAELKKSDDYAKELEKAFKRTQAYVTADVEAWYAKYAKDNNLTLAEARRQLSLKELRDYQMTVEEYMEKGRQLETHPEFAEELQRASAKVHMTRLQALKNQINMRLETLYGGVAKGIRERLSDVLHRIFGHSLFEIDKGTGIGVSTMGMSTEEAEKLLLSPWALDGRNFSDRIWTDKAKLMKALETDLTTCLMRGENPSTLIDKFAKEFDVSRYQAGRLLHTETAYFNSLGTLEAYKKRGVQEYQIEATLDKKTSEICQDMDGQHFKVDEYEVGITAPPFHPNCRTCTVPYFDDEFTEGEKRASRNDEGKTETTVPADMTYKEWEKKYLKKPDDAVENVGEISGTRNGANAPVGGERSYFNENASYRVDIPKYSQKVNDAISASSRKVAEHSIEKKVEYSAIIDLESGEEVDFGTSDSYNSVNYYYHYLREHPNGRYVMVHNHNTHSMVSLPDIQEVAMWDNLDCVVAVSNDGYISAIKSNGVKAHTMLDYHYKHEVDSGLDLTKSNVELEEEIIPMAVRDFVDGGIMIYEE